MYTPPLITKLTSSFRNLPIRFKLLSSFFLAVLVFTAFAVYLFVVFHGLQKSFSFLNIESDKRAKFIQLGDYTNAQPESVKSYILTKDVKWERQYDDTSAKLDNLVTQLKPTISDPREIKDFNTFIDAKNRLRGTELLILAKTTDNDIQRAIELFDTNYDSQQQQVEQAVKDMVNIENSKFAAQQVRNDATLVSARRILIITLVAVIIFTVVVALSIASFIARGINKLVGSVQQIAVGDLSVRVKVVSTDEIGELGLSVNDMAGKLEDLYSTLEQKVRDKTVNLAQKVVEAQELKEKAEHAQAKDEAILANIGEGMLVTDNGGYILLINEIAATLLGVDRSAMFGRRVVDVYQLYDEDEHVLSPDKRPLPIALATAKKTTRTVKRTSADGTKIALSLTATPVFQDGVLIGGIEIVRDVTKEKEVDRMKTEFISLASHQLRTPLSAIRWFTEMLLSGDAGKLNPSQAEFAHNVADSTQRMIELVNSLLNISRMESGRIIIDPKPTDLKELVSGIVNDLKAKTIERQQTLIISVNQELPKINLDARLIGQVYLNMLTNAIKYTPKGGEVSVFVSRRGEDVVSQVTDNGYGIPKAEQAKMFQKFFRAANVAKFETDGTGLGMYLVKSIIESSGGKIWFESAEGKGTTFWFTIPLSGMKSKAGEVTLDG